MCVFLFAAAWISNADLWLGRGGVWTERVEVAVSNGTKKAWSAQSVAVDVPALKNARTESIRLVDNRGKHLLYASPAPGRFILPVTAKAGEKVCYHLYSGNPHAWGLSDSLPKYRWRKTADAAVTVGRTERRRFGTDGENARWPGKGGREYRVPVRVCNPSDRSVSGVVVSVPSAEVFHATRNPVGEMTFDGRVVPGCRMGDRYMFKVDVPARHVRTYYLYVKSGGMKVSVPPVSSGLNVGASEIPSDQVFRENAYVDAGSAKRFMEFLNSGGNRIANNDFSDGLEKWTVTRKGEGISNTVTEGGLFGGKCSRLSASGPGAKGWKGIVQRVPVEPGRSYVFGIFAKGENLEKAANVHLHLIDADGKHRFGGPYGKITSSRSQPAGSFGWRPFFGRVEPAKGVVAAELHLTMEGGGTLFHDGAFFMESGKHVEALVGEVESVPVPAGSFTVEQVSPIVKVFPEHHVRDSRRPFAIGLARNETEDLQLALRSGRAGKLRVEVSPPSDGRGGTLGTETSFVRFVPVDYPSAYYNARVGEHELRIPNHAHYGDGWSGMWPDPVVRGNSSEVSDEHAHSVRISFTSASGTRAGVYRGRIGWYLENRLVRSDRYEVTVWDFDLPERPTFAATYDLRYGRDRKCWRRPGETDQKGSDKRLLDMMVKYNICPDKIAHRLEFNRDASGRITVDFTEYDRAAEEFFVKHGFPTSYSPSCFYLFGWGHPPKKFLGEEPYEGKYPYKGVDRGKFRPEYRKAYQDALRLYWNHMKEKGWHERIVVYVSDEPYFRKMKEVRDQMIAICDMIHEVDKDIPVYSSTWRHCPEWEKSLDVWGVGAYGCFPMDVMERMRGEGRRFWFTCDGQQCLDTPYCAIERMQPIYCWAYGAEQYEFWGCNWTTYNPWKYGWHSFIRQSGVPGDSFWTRYPNGDGYHIYPPLPESKDGMPEASLRLCAIRDGVDEHSYLVKLSALAEDGNVPKSVREAASALCAEYRALVPVPNPGGRYSSKILPEPEVLDRLRIRAGTLLSGR